MVILLVLLVVLLFAGIGFTAHFLWIVAAVPVSYTHLDVYKRQGGFQRMDVALGDSERDALLGNPWAECERAGTRAGERITVDAAVRRQRPVHRHGARSRGAERHLQVDGPRGFTDHNVRLSEDVGRGHGSGRGLSGFYSEHAPDRNARSDQCRLLEKFHSAPCPR